MYQPPSQDTNAAAEKDQALTELNETNTVRGQVVCIVMANERQLGGAADGKPALTRCGCVRDAAGAALHVGFTCSSPCASTRVVVCHTPAGPTRAH